MSGPLTRYERAALAALADQIDRESPSLAIGLRGPSRTAARRGATAQRSAVRAVLLVLAVLGAVAGAVGAVVVWGPVALAISAGFLVSLIAALTLHAACR